MDICPHRNKPGISATRRLAVIGTFVSCIARVAQQAMG
jgi:hypothetical protein